MKLVLSPRDLTLIQYYEVALDDLWVDASVFSGCVALLLERCRPIAALDEAGERIEQLPYSQLRRRAADEDSLAVTCYLWALEQLSRGMRLVTVRWASDFSSWAATPLRMHRFSVARAVIEARPMPTAQPTSRRR